MAVGRGFYDARDFPWVTAAGTGKVVSATRDRCQRILQNQRQSNQFRLKNMIITIQRQAKAWIMTRSALIAGISTTEAFRNLTAGAKMTDVHRWKLQFMQPEMRRR